MLVVPYNQQTCCDSDVGLDGAEPMTRVTHSFEDELYLCTRFARPFHLQLWQGYNIALTLTNPHLRGTLRYLGRYLKVSDFCELLVNHHVCTNAYCLQRANR